MPQPRKYASRAQQQAAYRQRRALSEAQHLAQKGLPPLPAAPDDAWECALEGDARAGSEAAFGSGDGDAGLP